MKFEAVPWMRLTLKLLNHLLTGEGPGKHLRTSTSLNKKSKIEKFYETIDQMKIAAHDDDDVVEIMIFIIFMLFQKRHIFSNVCLVANFKLL